MNFMKKSFIILILCYWQRYVESEDQDVCRNVYSDNKCERIALTGACTKYPLAMRSRCAKSCNMCNGPCINKLGDRPCDWFAGRGDCQKPSTMTYMIQYCLKRCDMCIVSPPPYLLIPENGDPDAVPFIKDDHDPVPVRMRVKRKHKARGIKLTVLNPDKDDSDEPSSVVITKKKVKPSSIVITKKKVKPSSIVITKKKVKPSSIVITTKKVKLPPSVIAENFDGGRKQLKLTLLTKPVVCQLQRSVCKAYLLKGWCSSRLRFMKSMCACINCDKQCLNHLGDAACIWYGSRGQCETPSTKIYMDRFCQKECGLCRVAPLLVVKETKDDVKPSSIVITTKKGKDAPPSIDIAVGEVLEKLKETKDDPVRQVSKKCGLEQKVCIAYAMQGYCGTHHSFMKNMCGCIKCQTIKIERPKPVVKIHTVKKSPCVNINKNSQCKLFKEWGLCKTKHSYMKKNCKKTCDMCEEK